jgi:hypothetical protein
MEIRWRPDEDAARQARSGVAGDDRQTASVRAAAEPGSDPLELEPEADWPQVTKLRPAQPAAGSRAAVQQLTATEAR